MKKVCVVLAAMVFLAASGAWAEAGVSNQVALTVNGDPDATILVNAVPEGDDLAEGYVGNPETNVYALNVVGTGGTPPYNYLWSSPDGGDAAIAAGDEQLQSPTLNIVGLAAGTYTFICNVDNGLSGMDSNVVTLTLYARPTVLLTSAPPADPLAPLNGAVEVNNPTPVVFTATGSGGWGAAPVLILGIEMSLDGGGSWVPIPVDGAHVFDNSVPNVLTLTINPTAAIDTAIYRATFDDGH